MKLLKSWNRKGSDIFFDSRFLKELAMDVFGREVLKRSSVGGKAARNVRVQHEALDPHEIEFIRGS